MGEINILTASFNGKLGELYGTKQFGEKLVKAIPFSHAPHSKTQKNSFTAFACLNRFSSGIAKQFFSYMGLSNKKMLKHNAVANLFKPCVQNHVFNISNLADVIKIDGSTAIDMFNIDYGNNTIRVDFSTTWENDRERGASWVCFVIDSLGRPVDIKNPNGQVFSMTIKKPLSQEIGYIAGSFRADKVNGKVKLHGLALSKKIYIINGYLNIDGFPNPSLYTIADGVLTSSDPQAKVENSELVFSF